MKFVLTHGYFLDEDAKEQQIMKPYAPLGLLYLSSHLRAKGYAVDLYDSTFGSRADLLGILQQGEPGVLGIYANLLTRGSVLNLLTSARTFGWRVILGGPEPSNYAEEFLRAGAELIVAGEGETTLERLLACNFDPSSFASIPGLIMCGLAGEVVRTDPAQLISDLDSQPWPDRERIDLPRYLATWRKHHGTGSLSVITARGCPYRCNWCSHSVYGMTHRRRSPQSVAQEVEWLLERYQPDMLWMADDVFTIHPGWLFEYAAELKRRGIQIPFECITRADRMNEKIVATLREIGCMRVWIGSESGSQRILDAMQRGVTVEQVRNAVELCRNHGIQSGMFLMWGYEGEDLSDIEATVEHVRTCRPDIFFTTVSYPISGTPYFQKVADKLVSVKPWAESTDRDYRIRGRHSRRFYQFADQLLRNAAAETPNMDAVLAARAGLQESYAETEV
jgi:anaerobic magnesium-protoporphyrin IX monomethyl ester cyclase